MRGRSTLQHKDRLKSDSIRWPEGQRRMDGSSQCASAAETHFCGFPRPLDHIPSRRRQRRRQRQSGAWAARTSLRYSGCRLSSTAARCTLRGVYGRPTRSLLADGRVKAFRRSAAGGRRRLGGLPFRSAYALLWLNDTSRTVLRISDTHNTETTIETDITHC